MACFEPQPNVGWGRFEMSTSSVLNSCVSVFCCKLYTDIWVLIMRASFFVYFESQMLSRSHLFLSLLIWSLPPSDAASVRCSVQWWNSGKNCISLLGSCRVTFWLLNECTSLYRPLCLTIWPRGHASWKLVLTLLAVASWVVCLLGFFLLVCR